MVQICGMEKWQKINFMAQNVFCAKHAVHDSCHHHYAFTLNWQNTFFSQILSVKWDQPTVWGVFFNVYCFSFACWPKEQSMEALLFIKIL